MDLHCLDEITTSLGSDRGDMSTVVFLRALVSRNNSRSASDDNLMITPSTHQ